MPTRVSAVFGRVVPRERCVRENQYDVSYAIVASFFVRILGITRKENTIEEKDLVAIRSLESEMNRKRW